MKLYLILALAATACALSQIPHADAGDRPCRLWVDGEAHYTVQDKDGNPRNNPDETLYPGDSFAYKFSYGFSANCFARQVFPVVSSGVVEGDTTPVGEADIRADASKECFDATGGEGKWFFGDTARCGGLYMKIQAKEIHCNEIRCYTITRTASDRITPTIMAPVVEVNLWEEKLLDRDGYSAINIDYTNYVYDPVAIRHEAEFTFKDEREGTVSFDYVRDFVPLVEEGGYECDRRCSKALREHGSVTGIGFSPYHTQSRNGGGMYAYTAPSHAEIGLQNIRYHVTVDNEGQSINTHQNYTSQLIVAYDPVYEYYEYTVLNDGNRYTYDDRQGVMLLYNGSMGSGSGDNGKLNEYRRSKINAFYPNTTVFSEFGYDPIGIDRLVWDGIDHISGTDETPWHSLDLGHAMFSSAGYGILRFAQEISDIMFEEENVYRFYHNVTTANTLASDHWGGYASYPNVEYTYQYPSSPMQQLYNITSYDVAGNIRNIPLTITATPSEITHDRDDDLSGDRDIRIMLDDYLYAKTLYDTDDGNFANGTLQELYSMTNTESGTGAISMRMNRTALQFLAGYPLDDTILDKSRYLAFELDSTMNIRQEAGDRYVERSGIYEYSFDHADNFVVGMSGGINVTRPDNGTAVLFYVPDHFGDVKSITVGDKEYVYLDVCEKGCTVQAQNGTVITIQNYWGSTLSSPAPAGHVTIPADPDSIVQNTYMYLFFIAVVVIVLCLLLLVVKKVMPMNQN